MQNVIDPETQEPLPDPTTPPEPETPGEETGDEDKAEDDSRGAPVPDPPIPEGCFESGGEEPAPDDVDLDQEETLRLRAINMLMSPVLHSAFRSMVDSMGINALSGIGGALGEVLIPYIKQVREVDLANAPRFIVKWFAACADMAEHAKQMRASKPSIIVP